MKETFTALIPEYFEDFRCIGQDCEDSCCYSWKIIVDRPTYDLYKNLKDGDFSEKMEQHIVNQENGFDGSYATIKLNEDNGGCPFLENSGLCSIHRQLGDQYLSKTCATYPRTLNIVNRNLEISTTLSCPEAARLALLNKEGIRFIYHETEIADNNYVDNFDARGKKLEHIGYFSKLRSFAIELIQTRKYPFEQRFWILGLFLQKVQEYLDQNRADHILSLIQTYSNYLQQGVFDSLFAQIPVHHDVQIKMFLAMHEKRLASRTGQRYKECLDEMLEGIGYKEDSDIESLKQKYGEAYTRFYEPFMQEHEYILENYTVNYMFKNTFPYSPGRSVFEDYIILVVNISLIKMHLAGMAGYHRGLTLDICVKLIQSLAKTVEHSRDYIETNRNYLKENRLDSMATMSILIKG
ncbi:flagellin lysine-N-methylase [Paenibacillus sp. MSJ-34]|uniref:flagellin lysine-N-methylase n=1 Tax=Paenibacillus sp. MSJ-34 TaxID=2841529 RepID=UPI001C0F9E4C|nr:flagellin lysine-N-methylase [Paenibacillus sp. MSJ-34]MBU5441014.1 flagellin lysine-N-methylase [Paenibacillus sp. MSJ-34]